MLTVAIQAGGESRRMGQDKALAPFLGKPLISRVIERLAPIADEVILTTNKPESYRFLGLPLYPDILPGRGALGGLYTALESANGDLVAVVACDMPFASSELIQAMHAALLSAQADLAIPVISGGMEPFHAVYRRETCLLPILQALQAGKWRVDSWFSQARLLPIPPEVVWKYDPRELCFWNVNTPDELRAAEALATQLQAKDTD
jgi:molybdopterin-guanine dinucleotide biosynthesis protein A